MATQERSWTKPPNGTFGMGGNHRPYEGLKDEWLTPPDLLAKLGEFDLDPCACSEPRPWNTAKIHYALPEQDGLVLPWQGRVWLNPPYGPETGTWLEKLASHIDARSQVGGTALIFARTETKMFVDQVWNKATAILFIYGRLYFHHADGTKAKANSGAPSCLVAYGIEEATRLKDSRIEGKFLWLNSKLW